MENKKILIVEDEVSLSNLLKEKFEEAGFNAETALDGRAGFDAALAKHPDLILLDIVMPRMDGIEFLRKLHVDAWGKTAKVILLTNLSNVEKIAEATELGAQDYLVKSDWKVQDIIEKVKAKLNV